jgi:hypothetical protein
MWPNKEIFFSQIMTSSNVTPEDNIRHEMESLQIVSTIRTTTLQTLKQSSAVITTTETDFNPDPCLGMQ